MYDINSVCQAASFPQRLGTVTWSCLLSQDHRNPWNRSENSLYLFNFSIWTVNRFTVDWLSFHAEEISSILNCWALTASVQQKLFGILSISWRVLIRVYSSALSLSGSDQMTDSPGRVPCVENESAALIHGEPALSALSTLDSCIFVSDRASDRGFFCSSRSNLVWYSASEIFVRAACSPWEAWSACHLKKIVGFLMLKKNKDNSPIGGIFPSGGPFSGMFARRCAAFVDRTRRVDPKTVGFLP